MLTLYQGVRQRFNPSRGNYISTLPEELVECKIHPFIDCVYPRNTDLIANRANRFFKKVDKMHREHSNPKIAEDEKASITKNDALIIFKP
jgi:hypothetical protein